MQDLGEVRRGRKVRRSRGRRGSRGRGRRVRRNQGRRGSRGRRESRGRRGPRRCRRHWFDPWIGKIP